MSKLILNVGDRVRATSRHDVNYRKCGCIREFTRNAYYVVFDGGSTDAAWWYAAEHAHDFLEKVDEHNPAPAPKCDQTPQRKLIKRERINVVNGKTQDEVVELLGHARGVQQFNTRSLGRTTGQAFLAIGQAMCNPGQEIRISKVDHAKGQELCSTSWKTLDKHFRSTVEQLLGDLKGFSFTDTHLVYNPIQTVETYVEYKQ